MKLHFKSGLVLFLLIFALAVECRAIGGSDTEVFVDPKYKAGFVSAPNPDFTQAAERSGEHGQGIYRLTINSKDGSVDEVSILHRAGRNLDASAVWTLFKWKAKPGIPRQQEVLVDFHLTRYMRQTR